jgi:hypothetical protein
VDVDFAIWQNGLGEKAKSTWQFNQANGIRTFVQTLDTSIMHWQTTLKDQYNYNLTLKLMIKVIGQGSINDHC